MYIRRETPPAVFDPMQPVSTAYFLSITLCVVAGAVYLYMWTRVRVRREYVYFALAAFGLAGYSVLEYGMLFADTTEEYGQLLRLIHIPAFVFLICLALSVTSYLGRRRSWLFWSFVVVRSVSLVLDLLAPVNISYNRITELKVLTYFGQAVKTPIGEPNRLMIVGQIALFIFLAVCVDAAVFAIKRGEIRKMLFAAVSTIVFVVAGVVNSILIFWGIVELPLVATPFYLCIVFAMLFELTHTASHAVQLATALEQREELLSVHEHRVRVAEQTAHEMSGRLIGAQEVERARLARELHDDLSQNLALLSIKLGMLPERSDGETAFQDHVDDLSGHLRTLATDVHRISHELHPSKLEQLGLVPAIRGFCRDIGQARNLSVEFTATDTPPELPADISLCLYRVVQEALQNVAKHSGASTANVSLAVSDGSITLSVSDDGKGFDPSIPIAKQSLGLVGMNERVRSVCGYLTTESVPGHGTTIIVKVPLITTERL